MAIKSADQITIIDVTDAYSVGLTSEAYTFVGNTAGAPAGQSCTTQAYALCGPNACPVVSIDASKITCPTGITATVADSGKANPTVTFKTTAVITAACEASIPVVVDGITVNKKFSFAVAKTGATGATGPQGVSITGVTNHYLASASATGVTTETTGWTTTMQTTSTSKKYLWMYQDITYSSGDPDRTVPVIIGTHGATGAQGVQGVSITGVTNHYLASASASGITTSTTGWTTTMQTTSASKKYLWMYQDITYSSGNPTTTTPVIIGTYGDKGDKGEAGNDALLVTITSSNGTVFKNNSGSTVLTAHVFKGGVEQSITDAGVCGSLGSIKWYKAGSATAVATAKTLTVSAADVVNSMAYTAQLEG